MHRQHVALRRLILASLGLLASATVTTHAQAQSAAAQRGQNFVRTHCVKCHAIDKLSPSPLTVAPPFRDLHKRYPIETLQEAFAEGIVTGHPSMPEFKLDPGQIGDLMAYFKTLE